MFTAVHVLIKKHQIFGSASGFCIVTLCLSMRTIYTKRANTNVGTSTILAWFDSMWHFQFHRNKNILHGVPFSIKWRHLKQCNGSLKKLKIKVYKTVILPVVLYGCKTWSLTLKEEHRLRVLRTECWEGYLDLKGGKISWRKLHNDELHGLYSLYNIVRLIKSRRMWWVGLVPRWGGGRGV
jgi:hypothetical protein